MPACLRRLPTILTRSQMTHGGNQWGKQWEMGNSDCNMSSTCSYLSVSAPDEGLMCDHVPGAGGDTLHTHQASGDPCSVLDIVNCEHVNITWILFYKAPGHLCLTSQEDRRLLLMWHECCVHWVARAVRVCSVFILMHPRREHWDLIWNVLCMDQLLSACRLVSICCKFFTLLLC